MAWAGIGCSGSDGCRHGLYPALSGIGHHIIDALAQNFS
jgi:hypothetical protein